MRRRDILLGCLLAVVYVAIVAAFVWWRPSQTAAQSSCPNFHPLPAGDISSACPPVLNIPLSVYNQYVDHVNGGGPTPNFRTWISPPSTPSAITMTVNAGTPTINLNLQFTGVKAHSGSTVIKSYERVTGVAPGTPGSTSNLIAAGLNSPDTSLDNIITYGTTYPSYRRDIRTFSWSIPGGFVNDSYTLEIRHRIINERSNGGFNCIKEPGDPNTYTAPNSSFNFGVCPPLTPDIDLFVQVIPACDNFSATPGTITVGQSSTLSWTTNGATSVTIDGSPVGLSGSMPVSPISTKTYILQATNSNGVAECRATVTVNQPPATKKYLKVYGNDVLVGGGFDNLGTCSTSNPSAKIDTYSRSQTIGGLTDWMGSSTQFGASALGTISQFFSAGIRGPSEGVGQPRPPLDLTFGNTTNMTSKVGNNAGGSSGISHCIHDYYGEADLVQPPYNNTIPNGTIPANIYPDNHLAFYFTGNVFITGSGIRYQHLPSGVWGTVSSIPSLYIVVRGNIFISNTVTQLDGVYVAQPNGSTGGVINTCTDSVGSQLGPGSCDNQLTVNGAFIAKQIRFKRTNGDLAVATANERADSGNIAEVFNFSPEIYLSPLHYTLSSGSVPFTKYDYITSLPPVL